MFPIPEVPSIAVQLAALRAERREFVRLHHPDVGGDRVEFAAGLRQFDLRAEVLLASDVSSVRVTAVRRKHGVARFIEVVRHIFVHDRRTPRVR